MKFLLVRLALWFVTLLVFPIPAALVPRSFELEVLQRFIADASLQPPPAISARTSAALPPGSKKTLGLERDWTERVLDYLKKAEAKEIDPWLRDDIRIAWITTHWAQRGVPEWSWHRDQPPYAAATWQVLHCAPSEVWPRIVARRQAMLGAEYANFFPGATSPKKPCLSVGRNGKPKASMASQALV